jgi:hypothetical protein
MGAKLIDVVRLQGRHKSGWTAPSVQPQVATIDLCASSRSFLTDAGAGADADADAAMMLHTMDKCCGMQESSQCNAAATVCRS